MKSCNALRHAPWRATRALRCASNLPRIVEPHHHYVVTSESFHEPLKRGGVPEYLPENFVAHSEGLTIDKAIHMECAPADPLAEAQWVEGVISSRRSPVVATVAACNLAAHNARHQLCTLKERCPSVVGVRYVVDYSGPFGEAPATHVFVSRHGAGADGRLGSGKGVDFLRDPVHAPRFEAGFEALADMGLTFDLQCAPEQLEAAAALLDRHPRVRVVLDHLGKPRLGAENKAADSAELAAWRAGMTALAARPNAYCKLSMLAYAVPGWVADPAAEALVAGLVRETIDRFGPERCMFSTNWWSGGAMANSDGRDEVDVSMAELWSRYHSWVDGVYTEEQMRQLFAGTAEEFYGLA